MTTDLDRALAVLKDRLADPAADAVAETLLVAHEIGGGDLAGRLRVLAADRRADRRARRDALAAQAGVRFARRFVLAVPLGMAAVGTSLGDGRAAYERPGGQVGVLVAVGLVAACWWWAGRILQLPDEPRVFA